MSDFSVVSEVGNEILKLLREHICPELIQSPESIKMVSPAEKNADFQLGLYLYDIQEIREYQQVEKIRLGAKKARFPSKPLNLFFVLYINSKSQMMSDAENELRIIGRAMQVLMDNAALQRRENEEEDEGEPMITLLNLSFEDKTKLWSVLNTPYQLAVFFSVSPVLLSSERIYSFSRVLETEYSVDYKDGQGEKI